MKTKIVPVRLSEYLYGKLRFAASLRCETVSDFLRSEIVLSVAAPAVVCVCGVILLKPGALAVGSHGEIFCPNCDRKSTFGPEHFQNKST